MHNLNARTRSGNYLKPWSEKDAPEMATMSELVSLLEFPTEKTAIEYKSWLNVSDNHGKATLAKAAIALANEGGGVIVLGMREDVGRGGALSSQSRPVNVNRYSQDAVNAAINRYADPQFHCEVAFATHPATNVEHAFVLVPGGMTVPVMSKRDCEGVISAQRCYVRKPGPKTEEPFTAEEWRGVMERCLAARRESMLNAIRVIVQGHGSAMATPEASSGLPAFEQAALVRWDQLVGPLPPDDDARVRHGHYELSFEVLNVASAKTAGELRHRMEQASKIKHTGWGPFVQLTRDPFSPRVIDNNVEAWLGRPDADRFSRDSAHCDYWRANPSGLFFLLRGYDEDASDKVAPGTMIDITLPIWRVGEALLYAARLAGTYADNPEISFRCRYTGLRNRHLGALDLRRNFFIRDRVSHDDDVELGVRTTSTEIEDNLVEILHPLLVPLYERFDFLELNVDLVREEVAKLRGGRF